MFNRNRLERTELTLYFMIGIAAGINCARERTYALNTSLDFVIPALLGYAHVYHPREQNIHLVRFTGFALGFIAGASFNMSYRLQPYSSFRP